MTEEGMDNDGQTKTKWSDRKENSSNIKIKNKITDWYIQTRDL